MCPEMTGARVRRKRKRRWRKILANVIGFAVRGRRIKKIWNTLSG